LGYSAGGLLAFEVVRALERLNKTVSHLVIIDARPNLKKREIDFSKEEKEEMVNAFFQQLGLQDTLSYQFLKSRILKKSENYFNYISRTRQKGKIAARIHLLKSTDKNRRVGAWAHFTRGGLKIYQGFGGHHYMLEGENLKNNAKKLEHILINL
jgi:fengycin family lipopeptide synthetase E